MGGEEAVQEESSDVGWIHAHLGLRQPTSLEEEEDLGRKGREGEEEEVEGKEQLRQR